MMGKRHGKRLVNATILGDARK